MKDNFSTSEKVAVAAGILFIIAGLISNEWLLARIFSPDGDLQANTRIAIWVVDIFLIITGSTFFFFAKRHQVMNLVVLVVTSLVCVFAAEGILRLIDPKPPKIRGLLIENDQKTGSYGLRPNVNIATKLGLKKIVIRTNSDGMWWREVSRENPLKKTRIAFVGDSFTFGIWADTPEKALVGVFDSQLNPKEYEVLNFGVPGLGPPDIALQVKKKVLAFKPDYVILVFYNGNDFRDAYFGMKKYKMVDGIAVWNDSIEKEIIPEAFRKKPTITDSLKKSALFRRFNSLILMHLSVNRRSGPGFDFSASRMFGAQSFWSTKDYPEVALKARDWH